MARLQSVCPGCGAVFTRDTGTNTAYCPDCRPKDESWRLRDKTTDQRGYGYNWQQLSKRARRLQPFCTDCGATEDLTADHTEQAWQRYDAGKTVRLKDIDVVCRGCNSERGKARGDDIGERRKIVDAERLEREEFLCDD